MKSNYSFKNIREKFPYVLRLFSLAILLLSAIIFSCNKHDGISNNDIQRIEIRDNIFTENIRLSDIIDELELIPLESDSASLIGQIDKIVETDSCFFILDKYVARKIFVFDKTGHHLFNIGSAGSGPDQYAFPFDFIVGKDEVLVLDGERKRIIHYKLDDGKFDMVSHLEFFASEMARLKNGFAFVGAGTDDKLIITNLKFKRLQSFFPYSNATKRDLLQAFTVTPGDKILFRMFLNDTIYAISQNVPTPYLFIDFGNKAFRSSDFERLSKEPGFRIKNALVDYMSQIKYFSETFSYRYFVFFYQNLPYCVIQNKHSNDIVAFRYDKVINDITFEKYFPLLITSNNSSFIGYISPTNRFTKERLASAPLAVRKVLLAHNSESNPILVKLRFSFNQ